MANSHCDLCDHFFRTDTSPGYGAPCTGIQSCPGHASCPDHVSSGSIAFAARVFAFCGGPATPCENIAAMPLFDDDEGPTDVVPMICDPEHIASNHDITFIMEDLDDIFDAPQGSSSLFEGLC